MSSGPASSRDNQVVVNLLGSFESASRGLGDPGLEGIGLVCGQFLWDWRHFGASDFGIRIGSAEVNIRLSSSLQNLATCSSVLSKLTS